MMAFDQLVATPLKKNEVAILLYNKYSGVAIRSPMYSIIIDPPGSTPNVSSYCPDLILITHEHFDHLDEGNVARIFKTSTERKASEEFGAIPEIISKQAEGTLEKVHKSKVMVVSDRTSGRALKDVIPKENLTIVEPYREVAFEDMIVKAYPSSHPQARTPVTYMVTMENGIKLFHTSDSLPYSQMEEVGAVETPDIVFCTVGIAPGSSPSTGAKIASLVKAKLAIPYHGSDTREFEVEVKRLNSNLQTKVLKTGEIFVYG